MVCLHETKIQRKIALYHLNTDSLIEYIKVEDVYTNIAKDVDAKFGTSSYELNTPLTRGKTKIEEWRKTWRSHMEIHLNFVQMESINIVCCCKQVCTNTDRSGLWKTQWNIIA